MTRALPLGLAVSLVAAIAVAQEPVLRIAREGGEAVVTWEPDPGAGPARFFHLYRGGLDAVGGDAHRGDPDGRCFLDGAARDVVLAGDAAVPGGFYYLLSWVAEDGTESPLGIDSLGGLRPNIHPCPPPPSDCPDGGTPVNPHVDWAALHGTRPPDLLPAPDFAAVNLDGTPRGREDLVGHPTVLWFYPAAGTSG